MLWVSRVGLNGAASAQMCVSPEVSGFPYVPLVFAAPSSCAANVAPAVGTLSAHDEHRYEAHY